MLRAKKFLQHVALLFLVVCVSSATLGQNTVPVVTGDARVDKLLGEMTLEEKMALICGASEDPSTNQGQAGYLMGVPRLGIPPIRMSDGPPGILTRQPSQAEIGTMGLAATFDVKIAEENGAVIGREAKSLGIDVVLEPFINIDRDITFERGYNTYGEDPVLTGAMGAAVIRGIQAQGVMAQAKHYVGYDSDANNVSIDPQTLHEIYVAPFVDAVDAGVSSIMCSYNKLNGTYACGKREILVDILRKELGFKGFVTSDWGATHAPSFINQGLDMEMPVGCRWFDKQKIAPLFPFGFGLSYTAFDYSDLKVQPAAAGGLDVTLKIRNSGDVAGDEVPQLYLEAPETRPTGVDFPVHALAAFDRIHLDPNQTETLTLRFPLRRLEFWSLTEGKWMKATGVREVLVGSSSRNLPLSAKIRIRWAGVFGINVGLTHRVTQMAEDHPNWKLASKSGEKGALIVCGDHSHA
ncbi:MAG TPA: glycoside hydrolase family 3 N-terminal domain-containing protein [Candidatus Sulfotelmatobacter sp.]|nr:glycoside hydrolase family 3 N-terminal domain-containing protein [Candidatus Sulfotelmatobacter sp.]